MLLYGFHLAFPFPFLDHVRHLVLVFAFPLARWVLSPAEPALGLAFAFVTLAGVCDSAAEAHSGVGIRAYVSSMADFAALLADVKVLAVKPAPD